MLHEVVAGEHDAGTVLEAPRRDPVVVGVDGEHLPALPVAHRIIDWAVHIVGVEHRDRGVVAAGENQITVADALTARCGHARGGGVVQAPVERIGDLDGVAHQQCVFAWRPGLRGSRPARRRPSRPDPRCAAGRGCGTTPPRGAPAPAHHRAEPGKLSVLLGHASATLATRSVSRADRYTVGRTCRRAP